MNGPPRIGRRGFFGSGLAVGVAACSRTSLPAATLCAPEPGGPAPLAARFTTVASLPTDGGLWYMHDPGMTLLPSGSILVAAPCWPIVKNGDVGADPSRAYRTFICRSDDGGETWQTLTTLDYSDATPFVDCCGRLYMFVASQTFNQAPFALSTSTDNGETWSPPSTIFEGDYWNCCTPMVERNGKHYWALQRGGWQSDVVVVAADSSKNLLDRAAWSMSSPAKHPAMPGALAEIAANPTPESCTSAGPATTAPSCKGDQWLEPNVVLVGDRIRVLLRTNLDALRTANVAMVCDLTEDATQAMQLSFTQFTALPGGQCKFFIVRDDVSRLFWMVSNIPADSQEQIFDWETLKGDRYLPGGGNDRRFLMLHYSVDCLNWFPAGCVARAPLLRQSFMYPSAAIQGDDLLILARTSIDGSSQHDADLVTFHRVPNFRALAMNLYPQ